MDLLTTDHRPETCSTLGLDCSSCMRKAAASVAQICTGMDTHAVQQVFLQLYPSMGCRPMASTFESVYREFSAPVKPLLAVATAAAAA